MLECAYETYGIGYGSSRGIGAGIARRFAQEGYRVAIHYREREDCARALLNELAAGGCSAMLVQGDLTSQEDTLRIAKSVRETLGFIDVLINNAGVALPTQLITETSLAEWNRVLQTNATGMFLMTKRRFAGDDLKPARGDHQSFFHVGRNGRLLRGGVLRFQSGGDRLHESARKGGCAKHDTRQLHCAGVYPDRHDAGIFRGSDCVHL